MIANVSEDIQICLFATQVNVTVLWFTPLVCVFGDEYVCSFSKYGVNKPKFPDLTLA